MKNYTVLWIFIILALIAGAAFFFYKKRQEKEYPGSEPITDVQTVPANPLPAENYTNGGTR